MLFKGLRTAVILGAAALFTLPSCKKTSEIGKDNDESIATPYNLFAGTKEGWLVNTNDGRTFTSVFPPDGYPIHAIATAGKNLIIEKSRLFYSDNNGKNFNPISYNAYSRQSWTNWILDMGSHNKTYMVSSQGRGVVYSEDNGLTWQVDNNWEANTSANVRITSFAKLNNEAAFAFSHVYNTLYRRDNGNAEWKSVLAEGVFPSVSEFFICSNSNELFITDHRGVGGAWYSMNQGVTWTRFPQGILPVGTTEYLAAASGRTGTLCVVTKDNVYYADRSAGFKDGNSGLDSDIKINGLTAQKNTYKNGNEWIFLYLSTTKGLYRSDDGGLTWDKVTTQQFDANYITTN